MSQFGLRKGGRGTDEDEDEQQDVEFAVEGEEDEFDEVLDGLEEVEVLDGEGEGEMDEEEGEVEMDLEGEGEREPVDVPDSAFFVFSGHSDAVYCAAFHPTIEGLIATGGGDDRGFVWKYTIDQQEKASLSSNIELLGHTDTVTSVGFNFNGSLLLTGSYDGTVRIWNVESGNLIQTLDGPEDIEWARWHSKGNAIIAGSRDGTVWMWLAHNGQCMQVFAGHDGMVSCGLFSLCGKYVCTAGEDGTVRVWLPKTGVCKHIFSGHAGHEAAITTMAVGDDLILTGSQDGTAKLYQISGLRVLHSFVHAKFTAMQEDDAELESTVGVESVGFSGDAYKWIATGGMDNYLKVWDISTGSCRVTCKHDGGVVSLKWHPILPYVCTGSIDGVVRIWDARNGQCSYVFTGHTNMVTSVDIKIKGGEGSYENESVVISVSDDGTSRLFRALLSN